MQTHVNRNGGAAFGSDLPNGNFVLKGQVVYTPAPQQLICRPDAYLVCRDGRVDGVYTALPEIVRDEPLIDFGDRIILPGLSDLHVHAAQFAFRGLGMDMPLLDWLNHHAFPEETRFADPDYAGRVYGLFADRVLRSPTTRLAAWGSVHRAGTEQLMAALSARGLCGYAGKINMDRNSAPALTETVSGSLSETEQWVRHTKGRYPGVEPILTPRFIPTCSPELLSGLARLSDQYAVPVQSHVSENLSEIGWVASLEPAASSYSGAYDQYGLFGSSQPVIMAHMVHPSPDEWRLMKSRRVAIAHCPGSNMNVMSGLAPVRQMLDAGIFVGLGTDVAGGFSLSLFRAMTDAVQVSKMRASLTAAGIRLGGNDPDGTAVKVDAPVAAEKPLTIVEALWMATKGGGRFFGRVGSFEPGYAFDAVVLDDSALCEDMAYTLPDRVERLIYLYPEIQVAAKYIAGRCVLADGP